MKYKIKKNPHIIYAIKWTGKNSSEIDLFAMEYEKRYWLNKELLVIQYQNVDLLLNIGDYLVKDGNLLYPIKAAAFEKNTQKID